MHIELCDFQMADEATLQGCRTSAIAIENIGKLHNWKRLRNIGGGKPSVWSTKLMIILAKTETLSIPCLSPDASIYSTGPP